MIEIPDDWPVRRWHEDAPIAHLETVASDAPTGLDPVRWKVASWDSVREIASSSLPGQVRHKTGLSVGTGKALVKRDQSDYPWKQRDVFDLAGSRAQILIAPEGATEIPTGQFQVAPVAGNITTLGVEVDLDERTVAGKDQAAGIQDQQWWGGITGTEIDSQERDPIWLISELAQDMGYGTGGLVPGVDGYDPILDVPFQGSIVPAHPTDTQYGTGDTIVWGESQGSVGVTTAGDLVINIPYEVSRLVPASFTMTVDTDDGDLDLIWEDTSTDGELRVRVETFEGDSTLNLTIASFGSNGVINTTTTVNGLDITRNPDAPNRVQIEVTLTQVGTGYTSASVRLQREIGEWFGPYVHTMTNTLSAVNDHNFKPRLTQVGFGTTFLAHLSVVDNTVVSQAVRDLLITTTAGPNGRIYLQPLLGTIVSPWLDPNLSVWTAMQQIVEAWQAALITDVYGDLRVLNRLTLSGVNDFVQERVIDIGLVFEDLPWRMDPSDRADRLVVKYRPATVVAADPSQTSLPTVWELQEVRPMQPGGNDVFFTLDYIYPTDLRLLPFNRKDSDNGIFHVWDAYRYNNGTGAHMDPGADIALRVDRITSATWKVFVQNKTASPFHLVDNTGAPYLKLRSSYWFDQTQEVTIERGLSATDAVNPLEIDLSNYVQNEDDANAITDFLWGRVNRRVWSASTVKTVPDYQVDLGDVVQIVHARTGVSSNALVTKVEMSGEPGNLSQKLDLLLIPQTWEDFDEAWANNPAGDDWDTFDALWAPYTWDDFDRTPTAITDEEIQAGM